MAMLTTISFQPIYDHSLFERALFIFCFSSISSSLLFMAIFYLNLWAKWNKAELSSFKDGFHSCTCSYSTFEDAYWMNPLKNC